MFKSGDAFFTKPAPHMLMILSKTRGGCREYTFPGVGSLDVLGIRIPIGIV